MNRIDRLLPAFLWLLGVLAVAGITHLVSIFALPSLTMKDAFAQISRTAPRAELTLLPPPRPDGQILSFADPAMVQAICPFDLAQGGLRLHADAGGDRLLTLSFRTPEGRVFYAMTDLAAQQGKMDVVVLTPAQLEIVEADDDEDDPSSDLRLVAPEQKGLVVVGTLAPFPGERSDAEERIKSVTCGVEQIAQE